MNGKTVIKNLAPYKQGMQIDEVKRKYGLQRIVKLASNENPFGYSDKLKDKFSSISHSFEIYPDGHTTELRIKLAAKLHVGEEQLVFGSGSDEIVQMVCRAFLYSGVNTIIAKPTFPQYKHNAMIEGAEIKEIPTIKGYQDLDGMYNEIDEHTKVIWLCSPNNPTGTLIPKNSLYDFLDKCPKHILVVLDEAYYEYVDPNQDVEAIKHLNEYENLIILRTFSKAYGLAGLRIGYGIANKKIVDKLNVVRGPFNTTTLAQKAALIALEDKDFIRNTVIKNNVIKQEFEQFLTSIDWKYYDSETNFLLVSTPISGNDVFQYLLENGFIVRPGEGLGCPKTIRVTIGNEQDMNKLQNLLFDLNQMLYKEKRL